MNLNKITTQLQDLVFKSKTNIALKILKEKINDTSERYNTILLLGNRYNGIAEQELLDIIDSKEARLEKTKLGHSILKVIEIIEESDLDTTSGISNLEIRNKILVFTTEDKVEKTASFFQLLNFVNVEVKDYSVANINLEEYDLFIFDNQDLPPDFNPEKLSEDQQVLIKKRIEKMELVINSTLKFLIHFGNRLNWVNTKRDRVQAANSKFSLHARTKEVIEFINTYRV